MDISKFKRFIGKLSVFRSYSSLLVPVIIALIAVLVFIPTQLMSSKLKERIANESISKRGKQIKLLTKSAVARNQWKEEERYQQAHETDANQITLLARQSTQRQLLSYKIFPEPKDSSTLIFEEFGRQFRTSIEQLLVRVNARDCPTDAELARSVQKQSWSPLGSARGRRRLSDRLSEVDATIIDVLCRERAECACVYVNPADLSGYEFWEDYKYTGISEAVEDCWYYQLAYWVIEDVIDTIGAMNFGSSSVFTSPVKRLLSVSFTTATAGGRSGYGSKQRAVDDSKPSYVLSIEDGLTEPCTRRVSNDDIDVVHFSVAVIVSTKAVLPFMQQLCSAKRHKFRGFWGDEQERLFKHNQITILESTINSIDREDETHSYYRYGEDTVVELNLICEYIFNKSGYDEIKPESVKEALKGQQEQGFGGRRMGRR